MAVYVDRTVPVHEHHYHERNGLGWVVGLLVLLALAWLLFAYGLPAFNRVSTGPSLTVPSQIDVNLNQGGAGAAAPEPAK